MTVCFITVFFWKRASIEPPKCGIGAFGKIFMGGGYLSVVSC